MRNSLKLLIGLAVPGLALTALWLWITRHANSNNDGDGVARNSGIIGSCVNTQENPNCFCVASEIASSSSSDLRDVQQEGCVNGEDGAAELSSFSSGERYDMQHTHCSKQDTSESNESLNMVCTGATSNVSDMSELSRVVLRRVELLENSACAEEEKQLEFYDESDSRSTEYTRNTEMGSSIGAHSSETNPFASSSVDNDSRKTNIESSLNNTASNFDHSRSRHVDNISDFDRSHSKDTASSEIVSVSQKYDDNVKGAASRSQSLDEYSDVSSAEGQAESPLDEKMISQACSDIENAPPESDFDEEVTWELEFPQALCGRLIGKKGKNVQKISQITGTKIRLIPQKENTESSQRLVSLTGSRKQLELALRKLREKFPTVPFTRLNGSVPCGENQKSHTPSIVCVALPENELCQVFVTNIVAANHFYVQLHDHSIHSHLRQLNQKMYECYGSTSTTMMPQAISTGMLCASLSTGGWWWRAQVVGLLMNPDEVEITWLDYGGRMTVATTMLRQLRSDFLQLPFQAIECYLSNVVPHHGESSFSMAACALFEELTQNVVLTARITSYTRDCPNLELYVTDQWTGQPIFVNREFVRRGFARWSEI